MIREGLIRNPKITVRKAAQQWAADVFPERWGSGGPRFSDWQATGGLSARFKLWNGNNWYTIIWKNDEAGYLISRESAGGAA